MDTTHFVDVVHLSLRDGILSLNKPMELKRQTLADLAIQLRQFLAAENAEYMIFAFKRDASDVKVALTGQEMRWLERFGEVITTRIVSFDTGRLTENGGDIVGEEKATFLEKMDQFLVKISAGEVRVKVKPRG